MQFKDVLGQEAAIEQLKVSYEHERTAHAQIFVGPEGAGGLALALAYSQYLLCEKNEGGIADACGQCNACKKVQKNIHPDLHFSYPNIDSKAVSSDHIKEWRKMLAEKGPYVNMNDWLFYLGANNQRGNINKRECVDIVRKFSFTRVEGRFKILLLWMPEYLDKEGNRLLKLIEEPEPNTVFLLVAERAELILNTILSRCQLLKLPALDDELIAEALVQEGVPTQTAKEVAYLSEGNYRKAKQLASGQNQEEQQLGQAFAAWLRACYQGRGPMVYWVEQFVTGKHPKEGKKGSKTGRKEQLLFLEYGLFFLRELSLLQAGFPPSGLRLSAQDQKAAQGLAKLLPLPAIDKLQQLFNDHLYFIERNAHPKVLFLDLSIKIHRIFKPL